MILAASNLSHLVHLHVDNLGKTGNLRIWLLICFAVLLPCSWFGTPKEFWGIAVGATVATAVACLMICVCIGLDMPADLKSVQQPTVNFESFFSGMLRRTNDLQKSKADFTLREVYFPNISKGTAFLLQGVFETDPVASDVTI